MSLVNGTIHKYAYNGQEQLKDLGLNVTEMTWRQYDNALGRFHGIDPLAATEPHRTPYHFAGNNPIVFSDPSGLKRQAPGQGGGQMSGGGGGTIYNTGRDRARFEIGPAYEAPDENGGSSISGGGSDSNGNGGRTVGDKARAAFIKEIGTYYDGKVISFSRLDQNLWNIYMDDYTGNDLGSSTFIFQPTKGTNSGLYGSSDGNSPFGNTAGSCNKCVKPSTLGGNLLGSDYTGGDNVKDFNGDYIYHHTPSQKTDYPAIGHDRRYDNLKTEGLIGLATDTRAIGADIRFVFEEFAIAFNPSNSNINQLRGFVFGFGLGAIALPKTIYELSTNPRAITDAVHWYNVSNQGVTNTPSIHSHNP